MHLQGLKNDDQHKKKVIGDGMKSPIVFLALPFFLALVAGAIDNSSPELNLSTINDSGKTGLLSDSNEPVALAVDYLLSCQNGGGGFGANPGSASDIKDTSLAVIALESADKSLSDMSTNGTDPLRYLLEKNEELDNLSNVEAQVGRYVVAMTSMGQDPRDINGKNYVQILKSYFGPDGAVGKENYIWDDAWVIMGLVACNESQSDEVESALSNLKGLQTASGGWAWNGGSKGEDPDTTGIILCALLNSGEDAASDAVQKGLQYLSSEQNADGGFSSLGSNAATDGWALLAIRAAGQNPLDWTVGSNDPINHLISLQQEDGSIWWKSNSEGMSFEYTANMILALAGGKLPPVIYG